MKKVTLFLFLLLCFACDNDANDFSPNLSGTGSGGSLAKFTVLGNHLVILNGQNVSNYTIESDGQLTFVNDIIVGGQLETIFPYGSDNILVGSSNAVHFLTILNDDRIAYLSAYEHLTACDPVVARNGIAFSTLKISDCRSGTIDFLEAIDITDIENPTVLKVYETSSPFGLAIRESRLFVCEKGGLTMYSYTDSGTLTEMDFKELPNAVPLDIIVSDTHLVIRTDNGFYNLSYGDTGLSSVLGGITAD
ncbi:hypothetical protein [Roseivirga sp. E12]|uniref:hypothetical protein n=1 Tax=Roseivirga sp. E12 TaxID=2819237 RepID=UPI001ABC6CFB|nr:hypothetical protein [Roseivirga sp. E12]MBO3697566.1 hypothetical protein [Roseivirga sp. E12]